MRLEQYMTEGSTKGATDMELSIVQAWNGEEIGRKDQAEAAMMIAKDLERLGMFKRGMTAVHMGNGSTPLSPEWKQYAQNPTPKTDLMIGPRRISLKQAGASQLMSGGKGEATATFHSAVSRMSGSEDLLPKIEEILNKMSGFIRSQYNVTKNRELAQTGEADVPILEVDKAHEELSVMTKDLFARNDEFRRRVVSEAATGFVKFGNNNGTAEYLLVFDPTGKHNKIHKILGKNENDFPPYINDLSKGVRVGVSWKSLKDMKTGENTLYSSVRLMVSSIKEEYSRFEGQLLTEGMITNLIDRVKMVIKRVWNSIKSFLSKGWENILHFLGLDGEVVMSPVKL